MYNYRDIIAIGYTLAQLELPCWPCQKSGALRLSPDCSYCHASGGYASCWPRLTAKDCSGGTGGSERGTWRGTRLDRTPMLQWPPPTSSQSLGPSIGCLAASATTDAPCSSPIESLRLDVAESFVCTLVNFETTVRQSVPRRRHMCAGRSGSKQGTELARGMTATTTALGEL